MRFAVAGSPASLQRFETCPGYTGKVGPDPNAPSLSGLLAEIDVLFVELTLPWLQFSHEHLGQLQKPIAYFENDGSTVRLDSPLTLAFQDIMSNYYKVHLQTQGQIGQMDAAALTLNTLKYLQTNNIEQAMALEIGSWTGCSSYFLARSLNSLPSRQGKLYCLDTWRGSEFWNYDIAAYIDMFASFRGYMTCYGVYSHIIPIVADSATGMAALKDDCFDIVFIDGDHRYRGVRSDIANALRKLKPGGLLMGHDCCGYADDLPAEFLHANLDKDCAFWNGRQYSCGVLQALKEFFVRDYLTVTGGSVWYKAITAEDKRRAYAILQTP